MTHQNQNKTNRLSKDQLVKLNVPLPIDIWETYALHRVMH